MFKSRADLLIAAGESIKMQEKHGIEPVFKLCGKQELFYLFGQWFNDKLEVYEFPLAVVEGKPVFIGDELYCHKGEKRVVVSAGHDSDGLETLKFTPFANSYVTSCSWNQPKPKTVIVELLRKDAELFAESYENSFQQSTHMRIGIACRKALEKTK